VTDAPYINHEERHREMVERMAADLKPGRPLWPVRVRLALWLLQEFAILAWVVTHTSNDLVLKLQRPGYALEAALFAAAAVLSAVLALRTAIPGRNARSSEIALLLILTAAGTALLAGEPVRTSYQLSEFVRAGLMCAYSTCLLAALPWIALAWAVKRAAPMHGAASGALIGASALLFSYALMLIRCPIDEPLHVIVWHLLPALIAISLSALAGAFLLRFRPRRSRRFSAA
jgi:hypothetical protein